MSSSVSTATTIDLPGPDGRLAAYRLGEPGRWIRPTRPITSRVAYAAAHVVPRVLGDNTPGRPADIDWDATLAFRHDLWAWGLGVAEAMDTAQRGMGLDWPATQELIRRSSAEAASVGGRIACGAGTDQLDPHEVRAGATGLDTVLAAYREQLAVVQEAGSRAIVMASRALARVAASPGDYRAVYDPLLAEVTEPVILHWLGDMFDPALSGYWGSRDVEVATDAFVELVTDHADRVDGVKVSLLDADHERRLRGLLPEGVRCYTGDDFNYPELICPEPIPPEPIPPEPSDADGAVGQQEGGGYSDALLGIFAGIAPAASTALQALDIGDVTHAREILDTTRALGRHLFGAPTYYYKTGIAFLAWLNGYQPGFTMVNGLEAGRTVPHLVEAFRLADAAGLLVDPELAVARMRGFLTVRGVAA